jgi:hypothetical protein
MGARDDLARTMRAIYDLDLSRLQQAVRLGALSRRVTGTLALLVAAGERDLRRKLRRVRIDEHDSAAAARLRAWIVTRGLRVATVALRQASAQAVAYQVELDRRFVVPARQLRQPQSGRRSADLSGGFDVLGGA